MNTIYKLVCFAFVVTAFSCSNEFDLIEGNVDIPIVYGLLDAQDTAHYIRLEKAFVDPEVAADVLSLDPNNLYYENAVVKLIRGSGEEMEVFTLERVDGNLEGYVREEGAFAQAPNYLYKIHNDVIKLQEEEVIKLEIELPGEETVTASTNIIERPIPTTPGPDSELSILSDRNVTFRWTNGNFAVLTSCTLEFHYREDDGKTIQDKSIIWELFKNTDKATYVFPGIEFYNFIASNIEVEAGVERFYIGTDYKLQSGGEEISSYLKVAQANLGITSSGDVPNFSNLSRGRGLFSSRSTVELLNKQLTGLSKEELKNNALTQPLNFK